MLKVKNAASRVLTRFFHQVDPVTEFLTSYDPIFKPVQDLIEINVLVNFHDYLM